jgi:hypothetical protein
MTMPSLSKYSSSGILTLQKVRRTAFCRQLCAGWFACVFHPSREGQSNPFNPGPRPYFASITQALAGKPITFRFMKRMRSPVLVRSGQVEFLRLNAERWDGAMPINGSSD